MATTQDRLRESERLEELWQQPVTEPERTRTDTRPTAPASTADSQDWSRPLLVAWVAVMVAVYAFTPSPTDPVAFSLWETIVGVVFTYALFASIFGLAGRRPWGLRASALAGGIGMVVAGACAATGHHAGAWWMFEAVAFTGLTAGSIAALRARH
jgi:hypothetical protein